MTGGLISSELEVEGAGFERERLSSWPFAYVIIYREGRVHVEASELAVLWRVLPMMLIPGWHLIYILKRTIINY